MSPLTLTTTPSPADVWAAVEAFWPAHDAAEEARLNLTRAQSAGVEELPADAEFLFGEADDRFARLLRLTGLYERVAAILGPDVASLYGIRPPVVNKVTPAQDWETAVGDWGQSRGAA